jgi:Fe2+ or Zn2+ uptake regulation protein
VPHSRDARGLPAEHTHGFQVVDCNVVFRGYCPDCASQVEEQDGAA